VAAVHAQGLSEAVAGVTGGRYLAGMALQRALYALSCFALACSPAPAPSDDSDDHGELSSGGTTAAAPASDPSRWPREFVAGPGTGPALFLHQGSDAPALGYVSEGVHFKIAGLPENGRVPVRIPGALKVRAWLSTRRMALRAQHRGKIRGTPAYVGPGDYVRFLAPADDPDWMRVEVMPRLAEGVFGPAVAGEFPAIGLSHEPPPADAEPPSPGTIRYVPAGREVPLYARPRGEVVATLPALPTGVQVAVLRERGEWKGVRAGLGPYLVGYTNAELGEDGPSSAEAPAQPAAAPGEVPIRLRAEADKPLWRLAEGTRVRFDGRTVAIFGSAGWGREMNRYENTGEVDLFVAADDNVAVRGMVRIADLLPVEGSNEAEAPAAPSSGETTASGTTSTTP